MRNFLFIMLCSFLFSGIIGQENIQSFKGYFNFSWDDDKGTILLEVDKINEEFLYVNALSAGVGSNDIGLDRGQLGNTRIVKFIKSGNKLLLVQPNMSYRAISDNPLEIRAVEEAFAQSVEWGFEIVEKKGNNYIIDLTPFLLRDAHDVIGTLKSRDQGNYKLDKSRSAIWLDRTKNFPENSEFEALLTFTGKPEGWYIRSVAPDAKSVTVRQHHSFLKLPDDGYSPRVFHPNSGYFGISYYDYATPISSPIEKKYIVRHRLEKKDPSAAISEAIEPIIYYLDPGCPEPIRSALLEGAAWWNQAFEAAGYKDAFQIYDLPDGADMLDARYNVIQWVHRSTRGWSYGASVVDPRTGEIIKGHVSLGSLRVRQDFMIAQGILSPYDGRENPNILMEQMALDRLRQLSAHEIGHTIGIAHNFAASFNDRASVMDYPHPLIMMDENGNYDFSNAYDQKIGEWDKRTVLYGYQDFPEGTDEALALKRITDENLSLGFRYISDQDARPKGGEHPLAHLWDNGTDAPVELNRLMKLRANALSNFGSNSITEGTPYSELEKVLVPVYLMHRYQIEAASKMIGGRNYYYATKGDPLDPKTEPVAAAWQNSALSSLLSVLTPDQLKIPTHITELVSPPAIGFNRNRESFNHKTTRSFDPISAAEGLINHTLSFMLDASRLNRVYLQALSDHEQIDLNRYLNRISNQLFNDQNLSYSDRALNQSTQKIYLTHLMKAYEDSNSLDQVKAFILGEIEEITDSQLSRSSNASSKAFNAYLVKMINDWMSGDTEFEFPKLTEMPPGSPIGCGIMH